MECLKHKNEDLANKVIEANNMIKEKEIKYNIETNNNFEVLANQSKKDTTLKNEKVDKPKEIDQSDFKKFLKSFLETYVENEGEEPKYPRAAKEVIKLGYNVFHLSLLDLGKFNPKLKGFLAEHHKKHTEEIKNLVLEFGEGLKEGSFASGLSVYINKKNYGQ